MTARFGGPDVGLNGRAFVAAQSFLLDTKLRWTRSLFPQLRREFEQAVRRDGLDPNDPETVSAALKTLPSYSVFAWLERHLQRMKYSGRYGLQAYHDAQRADLVAHIDTMSLPDGLLVLDPGLEMPPYYTAVDIHQHPGGVWSDEIAGFVYERGARTTTPVLGKRHADLHHRFTELVAGQLKAPPETLFDMACGFGKSTGPFIEAYREAAIIGMDLSAPCLKLAARTAADRQSGNVRYIQGDATKSGLAAQSQDLVTSTMFLHEMPPTKIRDAMAEAYRVLKPGGRMVHLDFYCLPDAFSRAIHYGHARRNNEPYMPPFAEMDIASELGALGFRDIWVEPFEEAEGALSPENEAWRFPWTVIAASKPRGPEQLAS